MSGRVHIYKQIATTQTHSNRPRGAAAHDGGDSSSTCARPARTGFTGSALPCPHGKIAVGKQLRELYVCFFRPYRMPFKLGSKTSDRRRIHIVHEKHTMRISHGQSHKLHTRPRIKAYGERRRTVADRTHGHTRRIEYRQAHVDGKRQCAASVRRNPGDCYATHTAESFHRHGAATCCNSGIKNIFSDTAYPVAAHLRLRTVGIEYAHTEISYFRIQQQQESVGPYALGTMAQATGK